MKRSNATWIGIALVIAATAFAHEVLQAQNLPEGQPTTHQEEGPRERGPGPGHRPPPPVIVALDINRDGTIDNAELANAVDSLKQLDANNDGALTIDELRPPRPQGGPGSHCPHPHGPRPDHGQQQQ